MTRRIAAEQEPEIARAYKDGETTRSIASQYGVSNTTIKHILHRQGVSPRPPGQIPAESAPEFRSQVVDLRKVGVRLRDIARRLRASTQTISRVLQEEGLLGHLRRGENSGARRKIRPEQEQELAEKYLAGAGSLELAKEYACTAAVVLKTLRRCGIPTRRRGGAISPFSTDPIFRERIRALWDQGKTQAAIAKELGCGPKIISVVLVRHFGIRCRPGMERHGLWKGGRIVNPYGYVSILLPHDHPYASMRTVNGYVLEHRLRMAEHLGRLLLRNEDVHHINGDKTDNRIENLQLRVGSHGSRVHYKCADCGSTRLVPVEV